MQIFSKNRCMSRTPYPWSHTWRKCVAPDWTFGEWGHYWCPESHFSLILDLCANYQLFISKSVSITSCLFSHSLRTSMAPEWIRSLMTSRITVLWALLSHNKMQCSFRNCPYSKIEIQIQPPQPKEHLCFLGGKAGPEIMWLP